MFTGEHLSFGLLMFWVVSGFHERSLQHFVFPWQGPWVFGGAVYNYINEDTNTMKRVNLFISGQISVFC